MSLADKDLHTFENIRRWYAGGDATMADSLRSPGGVGTGTGTGSGSGRGLGAGAATTSGRGGPGGWGPGFGSTLAATGYLVAVDQAPAYVRDAPRAPLPPAHSSAAHSSSAGPSTAAASAAATASGNARASVRSFWQQHTTANAHWLNRDAVMHAESTLARQLLADTHYTPDVVQKGRPYKSFPLKGAEADAAVGAGDWRRPPTREMLAREQLKYDAARDRDAGEARRRAAQLRMSNPADYFGGP
jgi:hypothetical protein